MKSWYCLRGVAVLRDLQGVETKFDFQMRSLVLRITHRLAILRAQLGILNGDRLIDRWMARDVRRVVRQGAERECVLVDILAFEDQFADESLRCGRSAPGC